MITDNQRRVLALTAKPKGITKGHLHSKDWRVIDRLKVLGLCHVASVDEAGRRYCITDKGRAYLES